jgi:hypothetical protein
MASSDDDELARVRELWRESREKLRARNRQHADELQKLHLAAETNEASFTIRLRAYEDRFETLKAQIEDREEALRCLRSRGVVSSSSSSPTFLSPSSSLSPTSSSPLTTPLSSPMSSNLSSLSSKLAASAAALRAAEATIDELRSAASHRDSDDTDTGSSSEAQTVTGARSRSPARRSADDAADGGNDSFRGGNDKNKNVYATENAALRERIPHLEGLLATAQKEALLYRNKCGDLQRSGVDADSTLRRVQEADAALRHRVKRCEADAQLDKARIAALDATVAELTARQRVYTPSRQSFVHSFGASTSSVSGGDGRNCGGGGRMACGHDHRRHHMAHASHAHTYPPNGGNGGGDGDGGSGDCASAHTTTCYAAAHAREATLDAKIACIQRDCRTLAGATSQVGVRFYLFSFFF